MRRLLAPAALLAVLGLAVPATAGTAGTYRGKATNLARDFNFGKVTMRVSGGKIRKLEIKAVTTSGCGGFMDVVFAPSDSETQIIKGSARIKSTGSFSVTYRPVRSIERQQTEMKGRISGSKVTGTFKSGVLCGNEGRFTATK